MQYSKSAYEVAMEAKEAAIEAKDAAIRTELAIKEFLSRDTSEEGINDNGQTVIKSSGKYTKKHTYWYTVSVIFIILVYYY